MKDHLIRDEPESCPYLPGKTARMPLYALSQFATGEDADRRLALGQRRAGEFVYQTACPDCKACIPLRLDVEKFCPNRTQRRIEAKGDRELRMEFGDLLVDDSRLELFNKHRTLRGLGRDRDAIDRDDYHWGFVRSCFASFEIRFFSGDELVALAICDAGTHSLSAVYTFYDPERPGSLGTYSILKQVEFCRDRGLQYLYLGFYIEECSSMAYKTRFRPHELLLAGQWQEFGL